MFILVSHLIIYSLRRKKSENEYISRCLDCVCIIHFMHAILFMAVFIDILLSAQCTFDSMAVAVSNRNGSLFFWISLIL